MAVDFSTRATEVTSPIEPETRVIQPVSRSGEIDGLNQIGRGLATGIKVAKTIFDNQKVAASNKRMANFSIKLNDLQDAADQGLSYSEVRTRARHLLQQELADNPNQEDEILKRYSTYLNQSGVDKILTPEIQAAQINQAQVQAAVENGFLSAQDMQNPQKVDEAIKNLEKFNASIRELDTTSKEYANQISKMEVGSKQRQVLEEQARKAAEDGLAKVGANALPYWRAQYEDIKARARQAGSEQERAEIIKQGITQLNQDFAQRTAAMAGDGLSTNQAKIDQILQPQRALIDSYVKELSGEYDTEMFDRMSKSAEAKAKAMVLSGLSDQAKQWIAMSNLSDAMGLTLNEKLSKIPDEFAKNALSGSSVGVPDAVGGGKPADLTPTNDDEKGRTKDYLEGVKDIIGEVQSGKIDNLPADKKLAVENELQNQMKGILKGVDVYGNATESAEQFQPLVDFFANPEVGKYLQSTNGIPPALIGKVQQVFKDGYQKEVVPLLQRELGTSMFSALKLGDKRYDWKDLVEPTMESGRFGFKLKDGIPDDFRAKILVRNLNNSSLAKVMNKMIISDSHIRGDSDYQKSFDEIAPVVFGQVDMTTSDATGSIEDFIDTQPTDSNTAPTALSYILSDPSQVRKLPAGMRNNNPGNIKYVGQRDSIGPSKNTDQGDPQAVYATPEAGMRAMYNLLSKKYRGGKTTPDQMIAGRGGWTPGNHQAAANVARTMGIDPNDDINFNDPASAARFMRALILQEHGKSGMLYSNDMIASAIQ